MKLNLKARLVAAICQFKATHDIRYYLNGVYVEPIPTGGVMIVATNGHAMGIWRDTTGSVERPAILRIGKRLESACMGSDLKRLTIVDDRLAVLMDKTCLKVYIQHKEGAKEGTWEIPGKFPSWEKVTPDACGAPCLHEPLNAEYVAMASRAIRVGSGDNFNAISLFQETQGKGIAVVANGSPDFFGIIMPMLRDGGAKFPKWITDRKAVLAANSDIPLPGQQPSDAEPVEGGTA